MKSPVSAGALPGLALALALAGCAQDPAPTAQLSLTDQAIAQARGAGAEGGEALVLAERKQAEAQAAVADGRYREARLLTEQAELDARLAEAQVLDDKARAQIDELQRAIERLRRQLGGTP